MAPGDGIEVRAAVAEDDDLAVQDRVSAGDGFSVSARSGT
jgi:hypothetical protein